MPNIKSDHENSLVTENKVREVAEEVFENRYRVIRSNFKYFFLGLGFIFIILVGSGLVTKPSLLISLHDLLFGIDRIAVSYSNGFWLGANEEDEKARSIQFYADKSQKVEARTKIAHSGTGKSLKVIITIGHSEELFNSSEGGIFILPITKERLEKVRNSTQSVEWPTNVFSLTFSVYADATDNTPIDDKVYIGSVINVFSRDRGGLR